MTACKARRPAGMTLSQPFRLIAPGDIKAAYNITTLWMNMHNPKQKLRISTAKDAPGVSYVQDFRSMLHEYLVHPEHKTLDHTGQPCSKTSRGLLRRRPVTVGDIVIIGKEANKLPERETGTLSIDDRDTYLNIYDDGYHWRTIIIPILKTLGAKKLAAAVGVSERRARDWTSGKVTPHPRHRGAIIMWLRLHVSHSL